jgi:hypothetical protein
MFFVDAFFLEDLTGRGGKTERSRVHFPPPPTKKKATGSLMDFGIFYDAGSIMLSSLPVWPLNLV